jgi:predicted acetyltransferase
MDIEVVEALDDDRTVIRRLLQLYHYDFSEFDGSDVNSHGEYLHRYFDEYWTDSDRKAFLFRVEGAVAGFALVFTGEPRDIAEFFVMRKYRGRGVGARAAASLFGQFPGHWTVRQQRTNPGATAFWRKAIRFPFEEHEHGAEVVQSFTASL